MNNLLFKHVRCRGFLKPEKHLKFIEIDNENVKAYVIDPKMPGEAGRRELEDDEGVMNDCYTFTKKKFTGFVVGYKNIVVRNDLTAIWNDPVDVGVGTIPGKYVIEKNSIKETKCAIVYYGNNRKRYVPVEMVEEMDEI